MTTPQAYVDESHSDLPSKNKTAATGYYVMSAYVGDLEQAWKPLERAWREALAEENLKSLHARKLPRGLKRRDELQRRFIGLIKGHSIRGVSCAIALKPYYRFLPQLRASLHESLWYLLSPHLIAAHAITTACTRAIDHLSSSEKVYFVFDQHILFEKVEDITQGLMRNSDVMRSDRIAGARHADSEQEVLIQTADTLAHEEFQYRIGQRNRWQLQMLRAGGQLVRPDIMNEAFMRMMVQQARRFIAPVEAK